MMLVTLATKNMHTYEVRPAQRSSRYRANFRCPAVRSVSQFFIARDEMVSVARITLESFVIAGRAVEG